MPNPSWAPTPADVALHVPWRAQDPGATFTSTSVPTDTQVQTLIDRVVVDVQAQVGTIDTTAAVDLSNLAKLTAAVGTAYWVELGWTDQDPEDAGSKAKALLGEYEKLIARLAKAVGELAAGGVLGAVDEPGRPYFGFPDPQTTWSTSF